MQMFGCNCETWKAEVMKRLVRALRRCACQRRFGATVWGESVATIVLMQLNCMNKKQLFPGIIAFGLDHGVGHFRPLSITRHRHLLTYPGTAMSHEGLCQVF